MSVDGDLYWDYDYSIASPTPTLKSTMSGPRGDNIIASDKLLPNDAAPNSSALSKEVRPMTSTSGAGFFNEPGEVLCVELFTSSCGCRYPSLYADV